MLCLRDRGLNADLKEDANEVVDVDSGIFELCQEEQDILEYLSGYIAYAVIHKRKLCQTCYLSIVDGSREVPELLALKCYAQNGRNPLKVPSQPLVRLMQACENLFCANETNLLISKCSVKSLKQTVFPYMPQCCRKGIVSFLSLSTQVCFKTKECATSVQATTVRKVWLKECRHVCTQSKSLSVRLFNLLGTF